MSSRLLMVLLAAVAAVALTSPALASAKRHAPSYKNELRKVDTAWRLFLNDQKALAGETQSATGLCQQAKDAESDPDMQQYAFLFWQALDIVVNEDARPIFDDAENRQDVAAKSTRALKETFTRVWRNQEAKRRKLRSGTTKVLTANAPFISGMREIDAALTAWAAHDCGGAQAHVATANAIMPQGEAPLNAGMALLKSLL